MLKMWHDLHRKFFRGGAVNHTAVYAKMITMLIFWWINSSYIDREDIKVRESFRAFFGIEKNEEK